MAFLSISGCARLTCRVIAGAVYRKRAGVVSRHHDDTTMRDENQVKKCEKCLILLNKIAGVVQWQNGSFPSCITDGRVAAIAPANLFEVVFNAVLVSITFDPRDTHTVHEGTLSPRAFSQWLTSTARRDRILTAILMSQRS
jgi:hypothetical protein